jgi:hypothetical protein
VDEVAVAEPQLQAPTIIGPDQYDRNGLPLEFHLGATWNKYLAVEVAGDSQLFDAVNHATDRTPANWFASWTQGLIEALADTTYTLPLDAWQNLRTAQYLYYRVLTSADKGAWTNFQTSTTDADAASAPRVQLTGILTRDPFPTDRPDTSGWHQAPAG